MERFREISCIYQVDGSHLRVVHAYDNILGREVILKSYTELESIENTRMYAEAQIQKTLVHPHICPILECLIDHPSQSLTIVLEKLECDTKQDIDRRMKFQRWYTEEELFVFLHDVSAALLYAKRKVTCTQRIAHRDVKLANILLTKERRYKLADFGAATIADEISMERTVIGTPVFFSPEIRAVYNRIMFTGVPERATYDAFKSDVYSLGIALLYMAGLKMPNLIAIENLETRIEFAIASLNMYSNQLKYVLTRMLKLQESLRSDIAEVFEFTVRHQHSNDQETINRLLQEAGIEFEDDFLSDVCLPTGDRCGICSAEILSGLGEVQLPCCAQVPICSVICVIKVGKYRCPRCGGTGDKTSFE